MSLMMLLVARAYAPVHARGALVEGQPLQQPAGAAEADSRPNAPCASLQAPSRRRARVAHARDDRDSLAA